MNCVMGNSGAAARGSRRVAGLARRRRRLRLSIAALGLVLMAPAGAAADEVDTGALRGSMSNSFNSKSYSRWDGINFGAQLGLSNMNTDFGNAARQWVEYNLRTTALQNEQHPENWVVMPSDMARSSSYGAFLGYNFQWDQLVVGVDLAYNHMSSMQTSAADFISRTVSISSGTDTVTIIGQSSLKLIDYATLRGRAGYAFGQFLPYAILGAAAGRFDYSTIAGLQVTGADHVGPLAMSDSKSNAIVAGFATGLGMDVALLPNVFLRGEWEFVMFAPVAGIRSNINTGRVGIGVKF
jgi:outer membrane immunogenic protein